MSLYPIPATKNRPYLISIRLLTEEEERSLKPYSYSILTAANNCPMWGVVRYGHRKVYTATARSMALEAGSALHEVFAAVRLWQLYRKQGLTNHAFTRGEHLFGVDRWYKAWNDASIGTSDDFDDHRSELMQLCFNILHSGDFYDNPEDSNRTTTNLETSTIRYVDEQLSIMDSWPVYVADEQDPMGFVGVEVPFDIALEYSDGRVFRFVGTIDGVHVRAKTGEIYPFENKSAIRLDEGWRLAFSTSHQQTGYCFVLRFLLQLVDPVLKFRVIGLKTKQTGHVDDYVFFEELRNEEHFSTWADWVHYTITEVYERYHDDWENAPRFTHSCNRYFRPCAMILFCSDNAEGRKEQFNNMVEGPLSPSEESALLYGS